MSFLWRFYLQQLDKRPIAAKAVSSAIILGGGDVTSQLLLKEDSWDYKRTALMATYGAVALTPVLHTWYNLLNRWIPLERKSPKLLWLGATVVVDQLVASPLVLAMFMSYRGMIDGRSTEQIKQSFKNDFLGMYKAGWAVWVPTQLVNFYFIPLQHRLLFINSVAYGWNTFIATKTSLQQKKEHKQMAAKNL